MTTERKTGVIDSKNILGPARLRRAGCRLSTAAAALLGFALVLLNGRFVVT
jgi:hypothetical protein